MIDARVIVIDQLDTAINLLGTCWLLKCDYSIVIIEPCKPCIVGLANFYVGYSFKRFNWMKWAQFQTCLLDWLLGTIC